MEDIQKIVLHDAEILHFVQTGDRVTIRINDGTDKIWQLTFEGVTSVHQFSNDLQDILGEAYSRTIDQGIKTSFVDTSGTPTLQIIHCNFFAEKELETTPD